MPALGFYDAFHSTKLGFVAGETYDGAIYCQDPQLRLNAYWILEPVLDGGGSVRMRDVKHAKCLVDAEPNNRGSHYPVHRDQTAQAAAQSEWFLDFTTSKANPTCYYIRNKSSGAYLAAGQNPDNHVYLQVPRSDGASAPDCFRWVAIHDPVLSFPRRRLPRSGQQTITYNIANYPAKTDLSADDIKRIFAAAWSLWIRVFQVCGVNLEVKAAANSPDLTINWGTVESPWNERRVAQCIALPNSEGDSATSANVTFSQDYNWVDMSSLIRQKIPYSPGITIAKDIWAALQMGVGSAIDLYSVAAHEFGHVLGLEHDGDPASIMQTTTTLLGTKFMYRGGTVVAQPPQIPQADVNRFRVRQMLGIESDAAAQHAAQTPNDPFR